MMNIPCFSLHQSSICFVVVLFLGGLFLFVFISLFLWGLFCLLFFLFCFVFRFKFDFDCFRPVKFFLFMCVVFPFDFVYFGASK